MIWSNAKLSPEVCSLLDSERGIAVLPAAARGRAVSRASAAAYTIGLRSRRPVDGAPSAEFASPHRRAPDEPILDLVPAPVR